MKKSLKIFLIVTAAIVAAVLVAAYPIYAAVVWSTTQSPDDFSRFPTQGVWVCEDDGFTMTIDLSGDEKNDNPLGASSVTIAYGSEGYSLECYRQGGHGTPLAPSAPSTIIGFEGDGAYGKVHFSVNRYKFQENEFSFLSVNLYENHTAPFIKANCTLKFVKLS